MGRNDIPAMAGGAPVRESLLAFARPQLGEEEERAVVEVLRSGWLGTGPRSDRFEREFAAFVGVPHAIAVSSCTAGLHLALRAAGVGPGDEVITSPITFPATANAILHCAARPVFADVLPDQLTLDPARVQEAITPRTRVILPVQFAGWPSEMNALRQIAAQAGARLIEDAAHALGATYHGVAAGALGDAAVFSFYATKNITTGEGGMITTSHPEFVERMRRERLQGIDVDASQRIGKSYRHWEAVSAGWKYNMSDIGAALGIEQLKKLPAFLARRRDLDARYRAAFADRPELTCVSGPAESQTAAHLFPVLLDLGALRLSRDQLLEALLADNIGVGVHFRSLTTQRYFQDVEGETRAHTPVANDASSRILSLPLYPAMSDADHDDVIAALRRILLYYRR